MDLPLPAAEPVSPGASALYRFGPFLLDPARQQLLRDGQSVPLTPRAFATLQALVESGGREISREELAERVWQGAHVSEGALSQNVSLVRKALGDSTVEPRYLVTLPARGYRFVCPVEVRATTPDEGEAPPIAVSRRRRRGWWAAAAASLLLLTLAAVGMRQATSERGTTSPGAAAAAEPTWVLLGEVENHTGLEVLDGTIAAALRRELASSRQVSVVPDQRVTDTLRLMRRPGDSRLDAALAREVALRDAGVGAVLSGRIERLGSRYFLGIEVVDPQSGSTVEALTAEAASEEELLPAVRRLSLELREHLGESAAALRAAREGLPRVTTPSLRALRLYSEADRLVSGGPDGAAAAEQLLREAVREDPGFASAYVHLAFAIANQDRPPEDYLPWAERGLALADRASEAERHFIRGSAFSLSERYDEAIAAYTALVARFPDHPWGQQNLWFLRSTLTQDYLQAVPHAVQRARLRPHSLATQFGAAQALAIWAARPGEAEPYLAAARRLAAATEPSALDAARAEAWLDLYGAHRSWLRGDLDGTLAELDRLRAQLPGAGPQREVIASWLGDFYLALGKVEAARQVHGHLHDDDHRQWQALRIALVEGDEEGRRRILRERSESGGFGTAIELARAGMVGAARRRIETLVSEQPPRGPARTGEIAVARGELALAEGRREDARRLLAEGTRLLLPKGSPEYFLGAESLARAWELDGELDRAVAVLAEAVAQGGRTHPPEGKLDWMRLRAQLARLHRRAGRAAEVQALEEESQRLLLHADPGFRL